MRPCQLLSVVTLSVKLTTKKRPLRILISIVSVVSHLWKSFVHLFMMVQNSRYLTAIYLCTSTLLGIALRRKLLQNWSTLWRPICHAIQELYHHFTNLESFLKKTSMIPNVRSTSIVLSVTAFLLIQRQQEYHAIVGVREPVLISLFMFLLNHNWRKNLKVRDTRQHYVRYQLKWFMYTMYTCLEQNEPPSPVWFHSTPRNVIIHVAYDIYSNMYFLGS